MLVIVHAVCGHGEQSLLYLLQRHTLGFPRPRRYQISDAVWPHNVLCEGDAGAHTLDCWDYEMVEESESFRDGLRRTSKNIDVGAELTPNFHSDMDSIDDHADEVSL